MNGRWAPDPWGQGQARWHDGTQWTGYVSNSAPERSPSAEVPLSPAPDTASGWWTRTPRWAKIAVPVLALLGIGALASANDPSTGERAESSASTTSAPPEVTTTIIAVQPAAIPPAAASEAAAPAADPVLVQACIDFTPAAAGMGMQRYVDLWSFVGQDLATLTAACGMFSNDDLLVISQDMQALQAFFDAATTTVPLPPPETTQPPVTSPPATSPPATAAPVPFVSLPPVTQPPAPIATSPPASSCDPNYTGCVPIASDVDCAGGSGNGPAYARGPIRVIGSDIYDLDSNGDGVACE